MIPIDIRKFTIRAKNVEAERCEDGSVRFVRYTKVEKPNELLTMRKGYAFDGDRYELQLHLPPQRKLDTVVTVAHTSTNCWKVSVSHKYGSYIYAFKTLSEVADELKRVFE